MNEAVMTALVGLIKEGGQMALLGIFLYQMLIIVKSAVIGVFFLICIQTICKCVAGKK